jgi:hypothetical protein
VNHRRHLAAPRKKATSDTRPESAEMNSVSSLGLAACGQEPHVHPQFAGSCSIKNVLPAVVPEMSYEGMAVANGQDAGLAWESLVRGDVQGSERDKIRRALLDYCGQDTLAMVKLLDKLRIACGYCGDHIADAEKRLS